jgi:hypothetical protein
MRPPFMNRYAPAVLAVILGGCSSASAPPPSIDAASRAGPPDAAPADDVPPDTTAPDAAVPDGTTISTPGPDAAATWPPVPDFAARGPFATIREIDTGPAGAYDVFHPMPLGAQGRKHPIISWANGTLYALDRYAKLVDHWASHGFVVIAAHTNDTAGGGTHKAGIDWLVAENARAGSAYFGRLDPGRIGAAGHSQGGGATIAAGSDAPGPTGIKTTLPLMPLLSFERDRGVVSRQRAPMFNVNASMDDRDPTGMVARQIFDGARGALIQATFRGVHEDAMNAAMHGPTVAWFRLQLMDDQTARPLFQPPGSCGLCQDAAWQQVRHKEGP